MAARAAAAAAANGQSSNGTAPQQLSGSLASIVSGSTNQQQQQSTGTTVGANQPPSGSIADMIRRSNSTADPSTPTGTTGGLMQGVGAGNLMGGVNQATGATGGLMQGASAGMTAGVGVQDDFQSTTEERLTALEGNGQGQVAQANVNNLESGATSNFIPQNQQKVVKSVVDGNKPSDRGIQQMMSAFKEN
jgi:hypothetical protein